MSEPNYRVVARTSEIALGACVRESIEGLDVLICHTAEGYFAVENRCSHADSTLEHGRLRGQRLFCPLHGAAFDVRDGRALSRPATAPIRSLPVRVVGEDVLIATSSEAGATSTER